MNTLLKIESYASFCIKHDDEDGGTDNLLINSLLLNQKCLVLR